MRRQTRSIRKGPQRALDKERVRSLIEKGGSRTKKERQQNNNGGGGKTSRARYDKTPKESRKKESSNMKNRLVLRVGSKSAVLTKLANSNGHREGKLMICTSTFSREAHRRKGSLAVTKGKRGYGSVALHIEEEKRRRVQKKNSQEKST